MAGLLLFAWLCTLVVGQESLDDWELDETSLLQKGFQRSAQPQPKSTVDVPEAAWAWALYQHVKDGPFDASLLSNVTDLELPGPLLSKVTPLAIHEGDSYYQPTLETVPGWLIQCLGSQYAPNNHTSWYVYKVTNPQIVPYIVPMDHPSRTDVSLVVAPGGGAEFLAWQNEGTDVAKWLNMLGISAFVLKYRVSAPEMWHRNAGLMDSQRAISFVRHIAPSVGLNPNRIGMMGSSWGGSLAVAATLARHRYYPRRDVVDNVSPKPDFLVLLYPGVDPGTTRDLLDLGPVDSHSGWNVSSVTPESLVPIFVAAGAADTCTPLEQLYDFHAMLRRISVDAPVEINVYQGLGHGFASCYRYLKGGWEGMQHEGCMWMLRARRFIMWQVEHKHPPDVDYWYRQLLDKLDTSLISTSANFSRVHRAQH